MKQIEAYLIVLILPLDFHQQTLSTYYICFKNRHDNKLTTYLSTSTPQHPILCEYEGQGPSILSWDAELVLHKQSRPDLRVMINRQRGGECCGRALPSNSAAAGSGAGAEQRRRLQQVPSCWRLYAALLGRYPHCLDIYTEQISALCRYPQCVDNYSSIHIHPL